MSCATSGETMTSAPPPSLTMQHSRRCSGSAMTRESSTSSMVISLTGWTAPNSRSFIACTASGVTHRVGAGDHGQLRERLLGRAVLVHVPHLHHGVAGDEREAVGVLHVALPVGGALPVMPPVPMARRSECDVEP